MEERATINRYRPVDTVLIKRYSSKFYSCYIVADHLKLIVLACVLRAKYIIDTIAVIVMIAKITTANVANVVVDSWTYACHSASTMILNRIEHALIMMM